MNNQKTFIRNVFILTVLVAFSSVGCTQNLSTGLVAHFPFDGDVKDKSTQSIDATNVNAVLTKGRKNKDSTAYSFNGSTSYMTASSNDRSVTTDITVSVWFKTTSTKKQFLVFKYEDTQNGYHMLLSSGAKPMWAGRTGGVGYVSCHSQTSLNDGKWHHLLGEVKGTKWRLSVDCVVIDSSTSSARTPSLKNTGSLIIGAPRTLSGIDYCLGSLDEIRIYNRALTQIERDSLCEKAPVSVEPIFTYKTGIAYPNPTTEKVHLSLETPIETLRITNSIGQTVLTQNNPEEVINVKDFQPGVYFIRLQASNGKVYEQKLIKI